MARKRAAQAKTKTSRTTTARSTKPAQPPARFAISTIVRPSKPTNLAVLAVLVFLVLVLALIFLTYYGPVPIFTSQGTGEPSSCVHGDTKPCLVGPCDGTVICINGIWSGCRWEEICVPGSRTACTQFSCPYGMKECNECGTGYGPCIAP
ncbi:MAG: hypothetical protein PHF60_02130 [Candidatus ainarchaeum sp.]|nr:hypothetical protein [Candidatus ainarchaeum sp.]